MMPTGLAGLEQQLLVWLFASIRPGAAFLAAPVFGSPSVPIQLRLVIALGIGVPALAAADLSLPAQELMSVAGLGLILSETLLGLAMGFAVQIGFSSAFVAGEAISNAMGLGFASMNDPLGGQSSMVIGQFLSMLATFLFLGMGGHLALATIVVRSFEILPPGEAWFSMGKIAAMIEFGGLVFSAGLAVALPVGFALILVQIVMAMVARSTPTLNLFAVGLPAALLAGIIFLAIATPMMARTLGGALESGLDHARSVAEPDRG
jgi:flagellar biosynthesis protein FliR